MKRALIFDFGGVLMKTVDYRPRHQWDERLALPYGSVESIVHGSVLWHKAQLGQVSPAVYWQGVGDALGIPQQMLVQLEHDYFSGDQLDESLIVYLRQLRQDGFQVGLLSNDSAALRDKLSKLAIADLFDPLLISAEMGVMKPDARIYHHLLEKLGRPAHETIFIDDRAENVQAAAALGIHAIHYTHDLNLPQTLRPLLHL